MGEQEYVFRGAAFGGFKREDVLSYIRKITEEHEKERAELRARLDAVTQQRDSLRSQVEQAEAAEGRLAELESQLAALTEENNRLQTENESLRTQRDQLQEQINTWTPNVNAYGVLKDQVAEIELAARQRGAVLLRQAEEQAEQLRCQARQTVRHTADWYDKTTGEANQTLDYLCGELERIRGELQALSAVMDGNGRSLFEESAEEENHE